MAALAPPTQSGDGGRIDWRARTTRGVLAARLCGLVHSKSGSLRLRFRPAIAAPFGSKRDARIADLGASAAPARANEFLMRDPVFVVEIVGPRDAGKVRDNVRAYITIPTMLEILLIHAMRPGAELLRKDTDGVWPERADIVEAGGLIRLASIGAEFVLGEAYAGTHLAAGG